MTTTTSRKSRPANWPVCTTNRRTRQSLHQFRRRLDIAAGRAKQRLPAALRSSAARIPLRDFVATNATLGGSAAITRADGKMCFSVPFCSSLSDNELIDVIIARILVRFARGRTKDWDSPALADYLIRRVKAMRRR
jgi:hypothetical protein